MIDRLPTVTSSTALAFLPEGDLSERAAQAARDAEGAYSPATLATYAFGVRRYVKWCDETGTPYALPIEPRTLARFVDDMRSQLSPASVSAYLSALGRMHGDLDLPSPTAAGVVVLALKRFRREWAAMPQNVRRGRGQAKAMQRGTIDKALHAMGDSLPDLRDAALIALAYDTLCRASELVSFTVSDLERDESDGSGVIFIRRSKTDQEGEGLHRYVAPDTMARLSAWINAARLDPDSPLFVPLSRKGKGENLSPRDVSRIYKARVGEAFSAHSTRVGGAVDQLGAGIATGQIAQAGGWKGEAMVARYTKRLAVKQAGAAILAQMQGRAI
jgi:integrase